MRNEMRRGDDTARNRLLRPQSPTCLFFLLLSFCSELHTGIPQIPDFFLGLNLSGDDGNKHTNNGCPSSSNRTRA